ncbi:MAG: DUF3999 family protein [Flavobacteriales bacterium]
MKINFLNTLLLSLCSFWASAQTIDSSKTAVYYPITGVEQGWNQLEIPTDILLKQHEGHAIQVFYMDETDSLEIPFRVKIHRSGRLYQQKKRLKLINPSQKGNRYFYTFENAKKAELRQINIETPLANFNWKVRLEGSENQKNWKRILSDYQMLGLQTNQTDYKFTELHFRLSNYRYFRLSFESVENPNIQNAYYFHQKKEQLAEASLVDFQTVERKEDKKNKSTRWTYDFGKTQAIDYFEIEGKHFNFFNRQLTLHQFRDSVELDGTWHKRFRYARSHRLVSEQRMPFRSPKSSIQYLQIEVDNQDDLALDSLSLKAFIHKRTLTFKAPKTGRYELYYGNVYQSNRNYNLTQNQIDTLSSVFEVGLAQAVPKVFYLEQENKLETDTENLILWIVLVAVVALLGYFSFKMLSN